MCTYTDTNIYLHTIHYIHDHCLQPTLHTPGKNMTPYGSNDPLQSSDFPLGGTQTNRNTHTFHSCQSRTLQTTQPQGVSAYLKVGRCEIVVLNKKIKR